MSEETVSEVSMEGLEASGFEGGDEVLDPSSEVDGSEAQVIAGASPVVQENIEVLAEQVKDAMEDGATKKEVQNLIKEFELKVNGKKVNAKIDLGDEEAVKRELQKAYAFNDVSQENAKIKKALNDRITEWKSDPAKLFAALDLDPTEWSANHLDRLIEEQNKSPEQKAQEAKDRQWTEMQEKLEALEAREARLKQAIEDQENRKNGEVLRNQLIQEIDGAVAKSSFLQNSPEVRQEMADLMYFYSEKYPDQEITAEMVAPILEKQLRGRTQHTVKSFKDEEIVSTLGKDTIERLYRQMKQSNQPIETKKAPPVIPSQTKVAVAPQAKLKEEVKSKRSFEDAMRKR